MGKANSAMSSSVMRWLRLPSEVSGSKGLAALAFGSQRLGVSQHSLFAWKRQLAKVVSGDTGKDAEIRQLKRELARLSEERDILKKLPRISPGMQSERLLPSIVIG